jgi:hypothetical protein
MWANQGPLDRNGERRKRLEQGAVHSSMAPQTLGQADGIQSHQSPMPNLALKYVITRPRSSRAGVDRRLDLCLSIVLFTRIQQRRIQCLDDLHSRPAWA